MLHLAQVQRNTSSGRKKIQLLAVQKSENLWQLDSEKIISIDDQSLKVGVLVLVELDEEQNLLDIRDAKDWILNLVQKYLSDKRVTLNFLEEEKIRLEAWKQELTLRSERLKQKELKIEEHQERLDHS